MTPDNGARLSSVVEVILSRRTTRSGYTGRPIEIATLARILDCGLAAPSSKDSRPWRFHVVSDASLLGQFADAMIQADGASSYVPTDPLTGEPRKSLESSVTESAGILASVPHAVFVENTGVFSRGRNTLASVPDDRLESCLVSFGFEMLATGAAVENILIAATAAGIHAAFLGDVLIVESAITRSLGICGDLSGCIALGYADPPPPPTREERALSSAAVVWIS